MEMRDDDGRTRTGTVWTASAHAVAAVIGAGVLALPWSVAQMGWIFGPIALLTFALITYYTAILLSDCYRSPDPILGRRNYTYMGAVKACLGEKHVLICGLVQYAMLWGAMVGYTITAATSMMSIKRTNCFHEKGHDARCKQLSGNKFLVIFGGIEVLFSQLPNLEKVTMLSVMAAIMSFTYSFVALYLCVIKFASQPDFRGSLTGIRVGSNGISPSTKVWNASQALGNIAFAFTYAILLIEIQDTLKSPPAENKTMKKASLYGLGATTLFYVSLGLIGYMAFGDDVPGNILTGFDGPYWLIDAAHLAVILHLIGAYQVYAQPIFSFYEHRLSSRWSSSGFFHHLYTLKLPFTKSIYFQFTLSTLLLRTIFIMITTLVAMMLPFFNAIMGLIGSVAFWPLTVHYPVNMYMSQAKIKFGSFKWVVLQSLSVASLLVSLISAVGSIADIVQHLKHAALFSMTL